MARDFLITVEPHKVIEDGMSISFLRKSDLRSYQEFVRYFGNIEYITEHNFIIGVNFVYGWMPTIFEFTSDSFHQALELLNAAKLGHLLSKKELLVLKSIINNSLVGTTKLLHFINPEVYAIWDSRVYRYLTHKEPYDYRVGNSDSYLTYLGWIRTVVSHEGFHNMKKHVENQVGYEMTNCRIVDLVGYSLGGVSARCTFVNQERRNCPMH